MARQAVLYRHFDSDGVLLYVGISLGVVQRLSWHLTGSHWADDIASVTIKRFPTKALAQDAEKLAILNEHPKYNVMYNDGKVQRKRSKYLAGTYLRQVASNPVISTF